MVATVSAVAIVVYSCKSQLADADEINMSEVPFETITDMFAVETKNGAVDMRMEADLMEKYEKDTCSYEVFPKGLAVYAYTEDDMLETVIMADNARHQKNASGKDETWAAFGHVHVENVIKQEIMETDTLYWDRSTQEIYTDCYVKMYSPDGFMQGYGMRSDERARNSVIQRPFNSFTVVEKDTTKVSIDTINFIGPIRKN